MFVSKKRGFEKEHNLELFLGSTLIVLPFIYI